MDKVRLSFYYGLLILLTVVVIVWNQYGMNREFVIFPNEAVLPSIYSDPQHGGRSQTTLQTSNDAINVTCTTVSTGGIHPYCGVSIPLPGDSVKDLSSFDELVVRLAAETTVADTVMFYLVNLEPGPQEQSFERVNLRTINASSSEREIYLSIGSFYVPSWWVLFNPQDTSAGKPNVNNVAEIRITTGDNRTERKVHLKISNVSLRGKYIKQATLYLAIISAWVSVSLLFVIANMVEMRRNTLASKKRAQELEQLNSFLAIEKDKFESMAKHDALTGALNRAGLRQAIDQAFNELREQGVKNSLILFDIDHFKAVNDTYGHNRGDEVLVELVQLISEAIRHGDHLARWGGEEFALVCLRTDKNDAVMLAEKLLHSVNSTPLSGLSITCSFGVAELHNNDVVSWFDVADEALYNAKQQGRNQVCAK